MNNKSTILITGGTGLIGTALSKLLIANKHDVIILSRKIPEQKAVNDPAIQYAKWNIREQMIDEEAIKKADHIVHLAGASVAEKRWTSSRKKEIIESRILSSELLVKALKEIPNNVLSVISSSAIGWYGGDSRAKTPFMEDDPAAEGFLGETCKAWEESIEPVRKLGKRLVKLRTGIVLSNRGGALYEFKKPLNLGVASILGNGKQVMSWIHIDDICRMYSYAIENQQLHGVYNAVAPHPATNKELVLQLAKKMRGNFFVPIYVPAFVLKMVLGEMSIEVLKSATVSNQKIRQAGFRYLYPSLEACIEHLSKELKV